MRKHSNRGTTYNRIYNMVRRIPRGRVATYGQIAWLVGIPRQARQIGYALAALRDHHPVPWHRVVNAKGEISQRSEPGFEERQRILLQSEGVVFDVNGRIPLSRFRWRQKDAVRHTTFDDWPPATRCTRVRLPVTRTAPSPRCHPASASSRDFH